jgi:biopolymer transport protein ExbD
MFALAVPSEAAQRAHDAVHALYARASGQVPDRSVVVAIPNDTEFYVDKERIARDRVAAEADRRVRALPEQDRIIFVRASSGIRYGTLVRLIDEFRALGDERIGLIADKSTSEPDRQAGSRETWASDASGSANSPGSADPAAGAVVLISIDGGRKGLSIAVDGTRVRRDAFEAAVHRRFQGMASRTVILLAPANISYASIMDLVDTIKAAGAQSIGFQVDATGAPEGGAPN